MSKLTTLGQMQVAYLGYSRELYEDSMTASPLLFVHVMHEWEVGGGGWRLEDMALARQFLLLCGYTVDQVDRGMSLVWQEEYDANIRAAIAMGEVDHTISLYYDEVITLEQALENLKLELLSAKNRRDDYFGRYEQPIML